MSDLQLFDALPPHIEAALRASIERFGVLVPAVVDQDGRVLDGHHRIRIAGEVGAECPTRTVQVADEEEAREVARTLNADRRHLTEDQRRQVAAELARAGHSNVAIAGALGVSEGTIRKDIRAEEVRTGTNLRPERVTGLDGKSYPATKPPSLDFRRAIEEFPELAPERSPGLPEKTVVQMADGLRAIPEGPEREKARDAASRWHKVHDWPHPREVARTAPSALGHKAIERLDVVLQTIEKAGGVDAVMADLDRSPLAGVTRPLWLQTVSRAHEALGEWSAALQSSSLRRVK